MPLVTGAGTEGLAGFAVLGPPHSGPVCASMLDTGLSVLLASLAQALSAYQSDWKTWQADPWMRPPTGQGTGSERLHCPYLELPALGLALLLQNMFILVSSLSWLPDQDNPEHSSCSLDLGQAG